MHILECAKFHYIHLNFKVLRIHPSMYRKVNKFFKLTMVQDVLCKVHFVDSCLPKPQTSKSRDFEKL